MDVAFDGGSITQTIEDLQTRCGVLLNEINIFRNHVQSHRPEQRIKLSQLEKNINADLKSLNRFSKKKNDTSDEETGERIGHALKSSNVPFYETVWATAKRSRGVVSFGRRFYPLPSTGPNASVKQKRNTESVLVDIVAENRKEWIKVSNITETRLLFEMAEKGWERFENESSSSEDDKDADAAAACESQKSEAEDKLSILRMAEQLVRISKATRVNFRQPRVRVVLPKLHAGKVDQIDAILVEMRQLGVVVETADALPSRMPELSGEALERMTGTEFSDFSDTLNIDCTILLALVSDLSHKAVQEEDWFGPETIGEIECEQKRSLLPSLLYPAVGAHALVCTHEAAQRFREITDTIGTESEKKRAAILVVDDSDGRSCETITTARIARELRAALQATSMHRVPDTLQLPIRIVDAAATATMTRSKRLPAVASAVAERLSSINSSVFLYGWRAGHTTLTSNRSVAKKIESIITASCAGNDTGLSVRAHSSEGMCGIIGVGGGGGGGGAAPPPEDDKMHGNHAKHSDGDDYNDDDDDDDTREGKGRRRQGDESSDNDTMIGPDMWICPIARSLIGKERMWHQLQEAEDEDESEGGNGSQRR